MNNTKIKPSRWVYLLAALPLILGSLLIMIFDAPAITSFPKLLEERYNLDNLTQVIVPGSDDIRFSEPGAYAVYYEYHSIVNGEKFDTVKEPPLMDCSLTSKITGAKMRAVPDFVETNSYQTKDQERVGVLIKSITIKDPGVYSFACQYRDGRTRPDIVVAVGPNFLWEFFKISWSIGQPILGGIAILFCAVLVSFTVILIIILKRARSRKRPEG